MKFLFLPLACFVLLATQSAFAQRTSSTRTPIPTPTPSQAPTPSLAPSPSPSAPTPSPAKSDLPTLTRIVQRYISPQVQPDSFPAQPKTYYIAGDKYSRIEESFDLEHGLHSIIIIREPDMWMINYFTRYGRHLVDPGPQFVTHHSILPSDAPEELAKLEFGQERAFFQSMKAAAIDPQTIDKQDCESYELKRANYRLVLNLRFDNKKPFQLDVFKDDKLNFSIRYEAYETGLPFDPALFEPPRGITLIEETK